MPLHVRKLDLKRLIPDQPSALLYLDPIDQHGERLFHLACREDLERGCEIAETALTTAAFDVLGQDQVSSAQADRGQAGTLSEEEGCGQPSIKMLYKSYSGGRVG